MNKIYSYLDELYEEPICELNYNKDYELLIAIMLSAQSTDKRVNKVTEVLFDKYRSIEELSKADVSDIECIIKQVGTYHRKAVYVKDIANAIVENGSIVGDNREFIESLSGVGRKTCNVFLSEFYKQPHIAVDTHVARVSKRLGLANDDDSVEVIENKLMRLIDKNRWSRTHYQMVLFGRYKCKAVKPECSDCKFKDICRK